MTKETNNKQEIICELGQRKIHQQEVITGILQHSDLDSASAFRMIEIAVCLVWVEGCDINQTDYIGDNTDSLAHRTWYECVVEIRLRRDNISPDKPELAIVGQTQLCRASQNSHDRLVKSFSDVWMLTPKGKMIMVKHRSLALPGVGAREW